MIFGARTVIAAGVAVVGVTGMYGSPVAAQEVTASGPPSLTIYNQQFAVVREQVLLPLKEGTARITFTGATAHLEPDSVVLRDPTGKTQLEIVEQNYEADVVSTDLLLSRYEGRVIDFAVALAGGGERIVSGKIVRAPQPKSPLDTPRDEYGRIMSAESRATEPLIEVDGKLRFGLPGVPLFPTLEAGANLRPTLSWSLLSNAAGMAQAELAYITAGLSWEAAYTLTMSQGEDAEFTGTVSIENQSGRTWEAARIQLMAGEVNRTPRRVSGYGYAGGSYGSAQAIAPVSEKPFDDYHLYTLGRAATLKDRETKQIEWVRAPRVMTGSRYVYEASAVDPSRYEYSSEDNAITSRSFGAASRGKVRIVREFKNTSANGLDIPLPQGKVRFYRRDDRNALQFLGESRITHTPSGEIIRVFTGNAFDLVGERRQTAFFSNRAKRVMNETFEITVRNRKKTVVTIQVVESLYRWTNWNIIAKSQPFVKKDSRTIEFTVPLKPDEERKLTYTVRYSW